MKKLLFTLAAFAVTSWAVAQTTTDVKPKAQDFVSFKEVKHDFGKIKQGVPQKGTFVVTNISKEPLIIEQANPTCGCTISDYTKEPIAPGKTGVINATFNAASMGSFDKHLTVKFAGIDEIKQISFKGEVLSAEEFEKAKAAPKPAAKN